MGKIKWKTLSNGDCINAKMVVKLEGREDYGVYKTIVSLADGTIEVLDMHISEAKRWLEDDEYWPS